MCSSEYTNAINSLNSRDLNVVVIEGECVSELDVDAVETLGANLWLVANLGVEESRQIEASEVPNCVEQIVHRTTNRIVWYHS